MDNWFVKKTFGDSPLYKAASNVRPREASDTLDDSPVEEMGDWTWPAEMNDLYSMLMGKAGELFNKEGGFGQEEIDAMFGKDFANIRSQEHGARDMLLQNLASQGMLGTGTETGAIADLAGQTEKNVGDVRTNIFLANEAQKRQDLQTFTQLASQLFGQSMDYNTTEEALNASRRNEANNMLSMLLQYYMASQGSQGG
ncbi:MAG: hypothetical protein MZV70_36180 [Desulfobacterales bacterium]|nr:hypothetical protein [Desulfobacterales bacterium]